MHTKTSTRPYVYQEASVEEADDNDEVGALPMVRHHTYHPSLPSHHKVPTAATHGRFHKIKSMLTSTSFSFIGIAQVLLCLIVLVLSVVYYTKEWSTNDTLRVSSWEITLDPCTLGDAMCTPAQQSISATQLQQKLNCSTLSVRTQAETAMAKAGVEVMDDTKGLNGAAAVCMLSGVSSAYDHASAETFSSVDVIFLCMSSQVLSTAVALVYMTQALHTWYVNIAIGLLFVYGICILFFQNLWLIPMNNIFVVEGLLISAVLSLGSAYMQTHKHGQSHDQHQKNQIMRIALRLFEVATAVPLLIVAVMVVAGVNTTSALIFAPVSVALAAALLIASKTEYDTASAPAAEGVDELYIQSLMLFGWKEVVFVVSTWIASLPAIVYIGIALYNTKSLSDAGYAQEPWAIAALVLALVYILAILTIQSIRFTDHDNAMFVMDTTTWVMRYSILLSIFVGALAALHA